MNFASINKYIIYLETYDPEEMGVDPQEYWRVESAVKSIRWKQKQTSEDVKQYLEVASEYLDENRGGGT